MGKMKATAPAPAPTADGNLGAIGFLALDKIDTQPQVRSTGVGLTDASIAELAESLKSHGQLQPVIVRQNGDRFILVAGHRRLAAAKVAGFATIRAEIVDAEEGERVTVLQLVENLQREDLAPADVAKGLRALYDSHGGDITLDEIGRLIGKSKPWVSKRLSTTFADFSPFAKLAMDEGNIGDIEIIHLLNQADKGGASFQKLAEVKAAVIAGTMTRAHVKDFVDDVKAGKFVVAPAKSGVTAEGAAKGLDAAGDDDGQDEDPDAAKAGDADRAPSVTPGQAIDIIESRSRAMAFQQAEDYAMKELDVAIATQIVKEAQKAYDLGRVYRNATTEGKLDAFAVFAGTNGQNWESAAWVNGATKRPHTMPDMLRRLRSMAEQANAATAKLGADDQP